MRIAPTRTTRAIAGIVAAFVLSFSIVTPSRAFVPVAAAVVAAEAVADFAGGVLIRAAGRQVLTSVGVAANDAAWATRVVSLADTIKSFLIGSQSGYQYEVQTDPATPLEVPPLATPPAGNGSGASEDDAPPYTSPLIKQEFTFNPAKGFGFEFGANGAGLFDTTRKFTNVTDLVAELNRINSLVGWDKATGFIYVDFKTIASPADYAAASYNNTGWLYKAWGTDNYYVIAAPVIVRLSRDANGAPCPYNPAYNTYCYGKNINYSTAAQFSGFALQETVDKVRRVKFDGEKLIPDTADPDWKDISIDTAKYGFAFSSASSPNTSVNLMPYKGGLSLTAATQTGTDVKYRRLELNNQAQVSALDEALYTNESLATLYSNKPALLPYSDPAAATNPSTSTGTNGNSIVFPDDYARENTAKSIATATGNIKDFLSDTSGDLEDPAEPDANQLNDRFFNGTFDNLRGWRLPSHASQCPTASFQLWGNPYVVDAHCTIYQNQAATLSGVMIAAWFVLALFIVLKA